MHSAAEKVTIDNAIDIVNEMSPQTTDGTWLEDVTVAVGPYIRDWDISQCYPWSDWPERERRFPDATKKDIGIDAVAIRRSDGGLIAIQCKSHQLDSEGHGAAINKHEIDSFASASSADFWAERWIVTNGDNPLGTNAMAAVPKKRPIKMVNIANSLQQQKDTIDVIEDCPHCAPNPEGEIRLRTKSCMQKEAVAESVRKLREHEQSDSGDLPVGQARGKIILPCGTGKTRISLRIAEELTSAGGLAIVMCPSIALVAQIRREYLQHAKKHIRALAVCSDETAGYNPKKESTRNTAADPTLDNSNVSASEVKGKVTTDVEEIAKWIRDGEPSAWETSDQISVIFGTYQSGRRIADAVNQTGVKAQVLIADEAHRTAGLRRKRPVKNGRLSDEEKRLRDFTLCHDNNAFPAIYRIYQTATPRIYDTGKVDWDKPGDWIVRSMDDERVFGVVLYRKSYVEAVRNGWLADYRIIALGINDPEAYRAANMLATNTKSKGKHALTSTDYLSGLAFALAMGGAAQGRETGDVRIRSCIAFMNTVDKSKNMAQDLQTDTVRDWLQRWLDDNVGGIPAASYTLEHLDATSNVTARENAKLRLAASSETSPHGVINVGIFGEGTDSPSLSAVAFLEPRKSPIEVIQAVGRAMRTAPGKERGYIVCPILIPPNEDPEEWLSVSEPDEGWQELGQVLLALRAHDQRIEDNLANLLQLYIPKPPETVRTFVAVASGEERRIQYREHEGAPGEAQAAIERTLSGESTLVREFLPIAPRLEGSDIAGSAPEANAVSVPEGTNRPVHRVAEPTRIIAGKRNGDGSIELRMDTVARAKPGKDGTPGGIDINKTKTKAKAMINKGEGLRLTPGAGKKSKKKSQAEKAEESAMQMLLLSGMQDYGNAIRMNLLSRSGLVENRIVRDLNILESGVKEAAFHMRSDGLRQALDRYFGLNNLNTEKRSTQADGCTIAALLMMNAAMLHQRIANGGWLPGVSELEAVKNEVNVVRRARREWERIMRHDFRPVLEPAVDAIEAIEDTGKLAGLERALRHLSAEAERIAETYADMGADHAGPLFNRVMGNQASDGAFFTRPVAASIAARLTLDACGDVDWINPAVWKVHKTVDLACGSGTLLAAILTEMRRRARERGAGEENLAVLQKLAVEETIVGMDINPVSLQLAASQLTAGNQFISYRGMGLHLMPYGPRRDHPTYGGDVSVGSLELLGQNAIVPRTGELDLGDVKIVSESVWDREDNAAELENAVEAARNARIVIMNPPFTNRAKMGEKFPKETQQALRKRADSMEDILIRSDNEMADFVDKNAIAPLFVALADRCLQESSGLLTMVHPTIALTNTSGQQERMILAQRYHIHTVLTCHQPGQTNLSQNTNINESIIVLSRHSSPKPPTRFINLDRMPLDEGEVDDLHRCLLECSRGPISNGWGEVSNWPAERIEAGDWTPAIWRSPDLADAAARFANDNDLLMLDQAGLTPSDSGRLLRGSFEPAEAGLPGSFPILKSKGTDGQTRIQSQPDERWIPKNRDESIRLANGGTYPEADKILEKAGYLLITAGQDNSTGRLVATADTMQYVGNGWMPVSGLSSTDAKAIAVFLNSTVGRLQLMRNPGRKLNFPTYSAAEAGNIRIPNIKDTWIRQILADCWEHTKAMEVPQFRDGECEVRRLWDEAVADALSWDSNELARLRSLLHNEPHVRGLGYNQFADEAETDHSILGMGDSGFGAADGEQIEEQETDLQLVPNQSDLQQGMDDPKSMKQLLEGEDVERYLRSQDGEEA